MEKFCEHKIESCQYEKYTHKYLKTINGIENIVLKDMIIIFMLNFMQHFFGIKI